jgi:hypothetical protein
MKKVLLGLLIGGVAVYGYQHFRGPSVAMAEQVMGEGQEGTERVREKFADTGRAATRFTCDGRTRCSQMTSCDEAMYFLENCPGVKMDGEGDGIPCEGQWCGSR